MGYDLSDYVEVSERIVQFREKHPEGSLQSEIIKFPENGCEFFVVKAYAYRSPDDPRPGIGFAQEPVPGKTSFTRDSELMNAETSAWGRAIVAALAADTKKGIASANEVRARQDSAGSASAGPQTDGVDGSGAGAAVSPPKYSREGGANVAAQTPVETQAAAQIASPSLDQSQGQGVAPDNKDPDVEHRDSVPSGSEAWSLIQEAVSSGRVKKTSAHIHAATLCTGREGTAVPAKFEDLKDCPPEILAEVAEHFGLGVAA